MFTTMGWATRTLTAGTVLIAAILMPASPAAAAYTTLCSTYAGCAAKGLSSSGYAAADHQSFWRMYPGNNCTNYVAYRMVKAGMPNVRPWDGSGNATYWGTTLPEITDGTPRVGAVAWWKAGVYPAGSAGHLAYVERVISPTEIVVSQSFWGGTFTWARITKDRGWPSGFIHFKDVPLVATANPAISGVAKVGAVLTADPGTWSPADVTTTYQWRAGGEDIPGATASSYTIPQSLVGSRVTVRVTASRLGYPTRTVTAPRTQPVEPGVLRAISAPGLTGSPRVDSPLAASAGTWTPAPDGVRFRWLADGARIAGATEPTFTPGPGRVGQDLAVRVTATRSGYADVSVTTPAGAVEPGVLASTAEATVSGAPRLGQTLGLSAGAVGPAADRAVQWYRGRTPVAGATGSSYALGADDLGRRVSARVTWTRAGYTPLVTRTAAGGVTRTVPVVRVSLDRDSGGLGVSARVTAPGLDTVPGELRVRWAGELVGTMRLVDGRASAVLRGLEPGTHRLRVGLPATRSTTWTSLVRETTLRR